MYPKNSRIDRYNMNNQKSIRKVDFKDGLDILLEIRFSSVVEQGFKILYGRFRFNDKMVST